MKQPYRRPNDERRHDPDQHQGHGVHKGAQNPRPTTMPALLRMLGIAAASARHQSEALQRWLTSNTPDHALRISLRQNGYGLLLNALFGRPPQPPRPHRSDAQS
jgi:hypothetical protein